ncbi:MAG: PEP-CTERM sorting domain-containing protein [Halomonadaceae bacterium]|nr:MAG: PEP-CTERM sorting domain-containing protein [Halomonadaceae bacterium]
MSSRLSRFVVLLSLSFPFMSVQAGTINLTDWAFNINGDISEAYLGDPMPGSGSLDASTGLGTLSFDFLAPGSHSFVGFFDMDIDAHLNTYFNEFGAAHGTAGAGQSWQIDEPGYVFGSIYDNTLAGSLSNSNNLPSGTPEDVSFALGWDFVLAPGETAQLFLTLSHVLDTTGFYLEQVDHETGPDFSESTSIYFWSSLEISGGSVAVPEPASLGLLALGLMLVASRRSGTRQAR